MEAKRSTRSVLRYLALAALSVSVVVAISWRWWKWSEDYSRGTHWALLVAAIDVYYREHATLPSTVETIGQQGCFGLDKTLVVDSFGRATIDGQPMRYLQAKSPGFVVAAEGKSSRPDRAYVVFGEPSSYHFADETQLIEILNADDAKRRASGQPVGWTAAIADDHAR